MTLTTNLMTEVIPALVEADIIYKNFKNESKRNE